MVRLCAIGVLCLSVGISVCGAQIDCDPITTDIYGGNARNIAINSERVYVAADSVVRIFTEAGAGVEPEVLGIIDTPGMAFDVAADGEWVFVANETGLLVYDATDLAAPELLASLSFSGSTRVVERDGDLLCVVSSSFPSEFHLVDVSTPSNPVVLSSNSTSQSAVHDVYLSQGLLAFGDADATGSLGVMFYDVTDPLSPSLLSAAGVQVAARDVAVNGDWAYVADWDAGLTVLDLTDITSPKVVATIQTSDRAESVAVRGTEVFVGDFSGAIDIFSVSKPSQPVLLSHLDLDGFASNVVADSGSQIWVASSQGGTCRVDTSDASNMKVTFKHDTPDGDVLWVAYGDKYGVCTEEDVGFSVFQVENGRAYTLSTHEHDGAVVRAEILGNMLYTIGFNPTFSVFEFDQQGQVMPRGSLDLSCFPDTLSIQGSFALVSCGSGSAHGISVIDIQDVDQPAQLDFFPLPSLPGGALASEEFAYATVGQELWAFQISNLGQLSMIGIDALNGFGTEIAIEGDYLYVATGNGVDAFDISSRQDPAYLSSYDTSVVLGGDIQSGIYFARTGGREVMVIDFRNVLDPELISIYATTYASPEDLAIREDFALICDDGDGLRVVDFEGCFPGCVSDLNNDGALNFFDVSAFLVAFSSMDPAADFTGDGMYNFFDVSAFLTSFNMGCP